MVFCAPVTAHLLWREAPNLSTVAQITTYGKGSGRGSADPPLAQHRVGGPKARSAPDRARARLRQRGGRRAGARTVLRAVRSTARSARGGRSPLPLPVLILYVGLIPKE